MPTNAPQGKTKWGVGSLFQQAVSGVESRLDVILANEEDAKVAKDGDTPSNNAAAKQPVGGMQMTPVPGPRGSIG
jgi:hypothetical protein